MNVVSVTDVHDAAFRCDELLPLDIWWAVSKEQPDDADPGRNGFKELNTGDCGSAQTCTNRFITSNEVSERKHK